MPRSKLAPFYFQLSSLAHSPTNLPDLLNLCTSQEHLDQWQIATTDREALSSRVVLLLRDRIFRFQKWMNGSKAKASDWHQRHSFVLSSPFFFLGFSFSLSTFSSSFLLLIWRLERKLERTWVCQSGNGSWNS